MHIYIYDSFLAQKKYESTLAKIETRITDLGLNGKIIRLGLLQSLGDSIKDEIKKGAKTIVAVGDNDLLHQCVNAVMSFYSESNIVSAVPISMIPVENTNASFANLLGMPLGIDACNNLSARRIIEVDVAKINDKYFLGEAVINTSGTTLNVNNDYSIEITEAGEIAVVNMPLSFDIPADYQSSAQDSRLEFFIRTKKKSKLLSIGNKDNKPSMFGFDELIISNSQDSKILLDTVVKTSTPATIRVSKKKLNLIVGKGRGF